MTTHFFVEKNSISYPNREFKQYFFRFFRTSITFFFNSVSEQHEELSFANPMAVPKKNFSAVARARKLLSLFLTQIETSNIGIFKFLILQRLFSILTPANLKKSPLHTVWLHPGKISLMWSEHAFLKKITLSIFDPNRDFKRKFFTFFLLQRFACKFSLLST